MKCLHFVMSYMKQNKKNETNSWEYAVQTGNHLKMLLSKAILMLTEVILTKSGIHLFCYGRPLKIHNTQHSITQFNIPQPKRRIDHSNLHQASRPPPPCSLSLKFIQISNLTVEIVISNFLSLSLRHLFDIFISYHYMNQLHVIY